MDKDGVRKRSCGNAKIAETANNTSQKFVPCLENSPPRCSSTAKLSVAALKPVSIPKRSLTEWPMASNDDTATADWQIPATPMQRISDAAYNEVLPELQMKGRKLSCYCSDKQCSRITNHIYVGSDSVARDRNILRDNGITHVLNCVGSVCPEYFKSELVYKTLWLQDSPSEDLTSLFYEVFDYFEEVKQHSGRVLVHCCRGVSRSTSLVIASLMWSKGQKFEEALHYVKSARPVTNPNFGFCLQLLELQKWVLAVPGNNQDSMLLRMYRIAPHSSLAPLHLVPKLVMNDTGIGIDALDSRGAFIVVVPFHAIYVWIGHGCHPAMENLAKIAASRFLRYERCQVAITIAKEGQEPRGFWDSFCCTSSITSEDTQLLNAEKICVDVNVLRSAVAGNKKVQIYDDEYDLFQKAIL